MERSVDGCFAQEADVLGGRSPAAPPGASGPFRTFHRIFTAATRFRASSSDALYSLTELVCSRASGPVVGSSESFSKNLIKNTTIRIAIAINAAYFVK